MKVSASRPADWFELGTSSDNTAQTISHAAAAGVSHYVCGIAVSADAAANFTVAIQDNDTNIISRYAFNELTITFDPPLKIADGKKVDLEVGAAGAGIATLGNMWGYTQ